MIPNFKTYIKESVWGNISKRAEGTSSRKEDDITNYNVEEMVDYINSNYHWDESFGFKDSKIASIWPGWGGFDEMEVKLEYLDVARGVQFYYDRYTKLFKRFQIDFRLRQSYMPNVDLTNIFDNKFKKNDDTVYIYPQKGDIITNQDVIFIIDRLLSYIKKPIIIKT